MEKSLGKKRGRHGRGWRGIQELFFRMILEVGMRAVKVVM